MACAVRDFGSARRGAALECTQQQARQDIRGKVPDATRRGDKPGTAARPGAGCGRSRSSRSCSLTSPAQIPEPMQKVAAARVQRSHYQPPAFLLDRISLEFDLDLEVTEVSASLSLRRNPDAHGTIVELNGEQLELVSVELDGRMLGPSHYQMEENLLRIPAPAADTFTIRVRNRIHPRDNTSLMGLSLIHI